MSDTQILTLAIAILVPLSLLLLSNSRITDAKETLRAEMTTNHTLVMATLERIEAAVKQISKDTDQKIRIHELEYHHK